MFKVLKNQRGFTLVELMVVVAIIAILSTIAVPNFRKFQAKAKTSEAKLHLSSIYSSEVAFLADADVYAVCLSDMGYDPAGQQANRYYTTGFASTVNSSSYVDNTTNSVNGVGCTHAGGEGIGVFPAGKTTGGQPIVGAAELENTVMSGTGANFIASAQGFISPDHIKKELSTTASNFILDKIVGKAYAAAEAGADTKSSKMFVSSENDYVPIVSPCNTLGETGSSLYSINDEKSLVGVCTGY